jgi:hypothetical protein
MRDLCGPDPDQYKAPSVAHILVLNKYRNGPLALLVAMIVALTAGTQMVALNYPNYLPGYLIQIPAVIFGFYYFQYFNIAAYNWPERLTLFLAFLVPLENTFILKAFRKAALDSHLVMEIFRPSNFVLLCLAVYLTFTRKRLVLPTLLKWSFIFGLAGWVVSTFVSPEPLQSLAAGYFQFFTPFLALFLLLSVAPDRQFLAHALALFLVACVLVSISLICAVLFLDRASYTAYVVPFYSGHFNLIKKDLAFLVKIGGNAYENPDFFVSLWVLLVPFLTGAYYASKQRATIVLALLIVFYAGFLQYSRAGIVIVVFALAALVIIRLIVYRQWSWLPMILIGTVIATHSSPAAIRYFGNGLERMTIDIFAINILPVTPAIAGSDVTAQIEDPHTDPAKDRSGDERVQAWKRSLSVISDQWPTGIGLGTYPGYVSSTPPHSLLLYRLAEGGVLSGISIVLLALYAPLQLAGIVRRRERDGLAIAALLALSAFMLKAFVFDASFALMGIIVWGFGFALLMAASITKEPR